PNMIIQDALREHGLTRLGFFSWTPFGLAVLAAAIAFMLVARDLLGKEHAASVMGTAAPRAHDLIGAYGPCARWHPFGHAAGSPLIDQSVAGLQHLFNRFGAVLVGFERHLHGKAQFLPALADTVCRSGDAIFVVVGKDQTQQLAESQHLMVLPRLDERTQGA